MVGEEDRNASDRTADDSAPVPPPSPDDGAVEDDGGAPGAPELVAEDGGAS
eukprot:CAMPEP_0194329748 /NCGR_PEP_ID=MMETSP0171-20130528/49260_1 /TAXON_ID=218684 /ORGANISM="Corethron pennatum, Strain L29A3" /LENGTH=50 /DNA_ID=CAMNT_0039090567 /DNA_START=19 /DNA_END=168 /DNA_ORIENTATION=-